MKNKDLLTYFCMDLKNFWNLKCTRSVHEIKKVFGFLFLSRNKKDFGYYRKYLDFFIDCVRSVY